MRADVLYLDNHLLVLNKPAGVLMQGDRTGDLDLLTEAKAFIKRTFDKPGQVYVGLVHRLDRPTSGVVVLARTSKSAARLSDQFRKRLPEKRYIALVEGALEKEGVLVDSLVKEGGQVRVVAADTPGARRAELSYRAIEVRGRRALVDVELKTGRPHQIRVQFSHRGNPIVGDLRYGARTVLDGRNLALHCYSLAVLHPTRRAWMRWQSPPPGAWDPRFAPAIDRLLTAASDAPYPTRSE